MKKLLLLSQKINPGVKISSKARKEIFLLGRTPFNSQRKEKNYVFIVSNYLEELYTKTLKF